MCSECGRVARREANFCQGGHTLAKFCFYCRARVPVMHSLCDNCGKSMDPAQVRGETISTLERYIAGPQDSDGGRGGVDNTKRHNAIERMSQLRAAEVAKDVDMTNLLQLAVEADLNPFAFFFPMLDLIGYPRYQSGKGPRDVSQLSSVEERVLNLLLAAAGKQPIYMLLILERLVFNFGFQPLVRAAAEGGDLWHRFEVAPPEVNQDGSRDFYSWLSFEASHNQQAFEVLATRVRAGDRRARQLTKDVARRTGWRL